MKTSEINFRFVLPGLYLLENMLAGVDYFNSNYIWLSAYLFLFLILNLLLSRYHIGRLFSSFNIITLFMILLCDIISYRSIGCEEMPYPKINDILHYRTVYILDFYKKNIQLIDSAILILLFLIFALSLIVIARILELKSNKMS